MPSSRITRPPWTGETLGLVLLACAIAFNAFFLAPELRIGRAPLNDLVFHRAASERLEASLERGEPFLDPWVSEWSLGYPVWRSYQPLGHLLGALVLHLGRPFAEPAAVFAALLYVLLVGFPLSVYLGARLLGLSPPASGLSSLLVLASSSAGDLDRYGLDYGALTWRGSGLFTQLVALHLLALAIGVVARALDARERRPLASILLSLTLLAHIIFGYVAFVWSAILAVVGSRGRRSERLVRLATIAVPALVLAAWFLVPLGLAGPVVNHSRWEDARKWDSYGAPFILGELLSGRLLDWGRPPVLTSLIGFGAIGALLSLREPLARRLLAFAGVSLALFFGRESWGHLLALAGVPADLHLHRLQAAFQLGAVLLAGFGLARLVALLARRHGALGALGALGLAGALVPIGSDRARYLQQNAAWGRESFAACERERPDLEAAFEDVRAILAERPGRASAGLAASWGGAFKVGAVPVYAFLSRDHIDQASFLYHAMSKTSDVMVLRDERSGAHDVAFGIRAVVAAADRPMPPHLRRRSVHGRFAVYEASPEGYFGIVDVGGHYSGPPGTRHEPSASWLASPLLLHGIVLSLDPRAPSGPAIGRWQALPPPDPAHLEPRGQIVSETKADETYLARVRLDRPSHVFVRITWSPDLAASVDGRSAPLIHVTPGFGAVPVPAGEHDVAVVYQPGRLKPLLFFLGIGLFGLTAYALGSPRAAQAEAALSARLDGLGARWATPRAATAAALVVLALVALHPLFRGRLIEGHDALEYPPRLVEMAKVLSEGHLPPIWAPDLGAGHGQPLFEFAPPLVYLAALPFHASGIRLADALQLGLAFLHGLGALAVYRLGRRLVAARGAALGGAVAWLFAPYLSLDLFVRAAFAEAAAVAVAPLALLGLLWALDRRSAAGVALGATAVALVPLAHNAAALLLLPSLALVTLLLGVAKVPADEGASPFRNSRLACLLSGAATILGGLGLAAYFWVPALLEKEFVHTDRLREGFLHWSRHLVSPTQLLWSPWGYGFSAPGSADGMSFAVGPAHLLLGLAGFALALRSEDRRRRALALAFGAAAVAGAWLSTDWAWFVWSRLEALQYLAYPWRALLLPGLFLPLLTIFAFERVGPRWTLALVAMLVVTNLPHTEAKGFLTFDDEYYDPPSIAAKGLNTSTREEYEPRWVEQRPPYDPRRIVGLEAPLAVTEISRRAAREELSIRAQAPTTVQASTFYYPGWSVAIDGVPATVSPAPVSGTMRFELPAGEHHVVIELAPTRVRRAGQLLTGLTALLLVAAAAAGRRKKQQGGSRAPASPHSPGW